MPPTCEDPARAGGAAGPLNASSSAADASVNTPRNRRFQAKFQSARHPLGAARYELAFRRHVEAAWRLGPMPMACLLEELSAGADLRATVARYAGLPPKFIADYRGDKFPPNLRAIEGGR